MTNAFDKKEHEQKSDGKDREQKVVFEQNGKHREQKPGEKQPGQKTGFERGPKHGGPGPGDHREPAHDPKHRGPGREPPLHETEAKPKDPDQDPKRNGPAPQAEGEGDKPIPPPKGPKEQIAELEAKVKELTIKGMERDLKIFKYENEVKALAEQYTKKMSEKALEAQKIVDEKIKELQADFARERHESKKYALLKEAGKLVELCNSFDMVLSTSTSHADPKVKGYAQGFTMVYDQLLQMLKDLHIVELAVKPGDPYNHDLMEIFEEIDAPGVKSGHVVKVLKKGFKLHDKVIAHALVQTAK